MYLSIVTTSYNSENTINNFFLEIKKIILDLKIIDYEIIVVDDGSKDKTIELLKNNKLNFSNLKIISLSKNYGHHKALMTGLNQSRGDFIFLIDSDLEENPKELKNFFNEIKNCDFVYGIQKKSCRIYNKFFWRYIL